MGSGVCDDAFARRRCAGTLGSAGLHRWGHATHQRRQLGLPGAYARRQGNTVARRGDRGAVVGDARALRRKTRLGRGRKRSAADRRASEERGRRRARGLRSYVRSALTARCVPALWRAIESGAGAEGTPAPTADATALSARRPSLVAGYAGWHGLREARAHWRRRVRGKAATVRWGTRRAATSHDPHRLDRGRLG